MASDFWSHHCWRIGLSRTLKGSAVHGLDTHTLIDVASILLAFFGGVRSMYRRIDDRIAVVEQTTAKHEGVLKGAGLL
jgi:hypothetical protein